MEKNRNVLIYGEIMDGKLAPVTKELLGGARRLADELGEQVGALFIGHGITEAARQAVAFGADRIYVADDQRFGVYETALHLAQTARLLEEEHLRFVLFGHTDVGADLAPRLAFRLGAGIATDCVELSVEQDTKQLLRTKPVYGGLAMATYASEGFPQIATVRPKSLPAPAMRSEADASPGNCAAQIVRLNPISATGLGRVLLLESVTEEVEGIKLEDADIIVSGGRGIGGREGFKELEAAARFLKGALAASRVACDNGWVPATIQIGITGKIVAPKVYIAVGVSGASQHMTGCSRSKTIVAINKDPAAAIFKYARFGAVGDWKVFLPAFVGKLKELE